MGAGRDRGWKKFCFAFGPAGLVLNAMSNHDDCTLV